MAELLAPALAGSCDRQLLRLVSCGEVECGSLDRSADKPLRQPGAPLGLCEGEIVTLPVDRQFGRRVIATATAWRIAKLLQDELGITFGNGCDFGPPHSTLFGGKMGRRKLTPIRPVDT